MSDNERPMDLAPHSVEAEEAVLGSILLDPDRIFDVKSTLQPADFFLLKNAWVFEAILELHLKRMDIDNLTVIEQLRSAGHLADVGGASYVAYLLNQVITAFHAETYAKMVFATAQRRRWLAFASEAAQLAIVENDTLDNLSQRINQRYQDVTIRLRSRAMVSGHTAMTAVWEDYIANLENPQKVRGLSAGIPKLDELLMGFRPGLYAIGGASSMGKSTFAGGLVRALSAQGRGLYVPTEVSGGKAMQKIATDTAGIQYKQYLSGYLNAKQRHDFETAFVQIARHEDNLTVLDSERPSISEIEAEVIRSGAQWLLIDSGTAMAYQNIDNRKQNDMRMAVTRLCQQLQNIARAGVVVIALWQTGRNAKDRQNKEPRINDFKEAGAIEETADVCLGLYRHDYYVSRNDAKPNDKYPTGTATVFVLKDRDGGDGDGFVTLGFRPGYGFTAPVDYTLDGVNGR